MVRVIHLSTNSGRGGAGKAALRISECIGEGNFASTVLSLYGKEGDNRYVLIGNAAHRFLAGILRVMHRMLFCVIYDDHFVYRSLSLYSHGFYKYVNNMKPDIVCIHWVQGEFFSIRDLQQLDCIKVMICHDQYYLSALAHHPINSQSRRTFRLTLFGWLREKLERWDIERKASLIENIDCIVVPSKWLYEKAATSRLNKSTHVSLIHLPITVPGAISSRSAQEVTAKRTYNRKSTILMGGIGAKEDYYKGFDLMPQILEGLRTSDTDFRIIMVGPPWFGEIASIYNAEYLGEVRSDAEMSRIYGRSDIFLQPSRLETCSQMILESIVHGTPVCAFDCYGAKELVRHGVSGRLVPAYNIGRLIESCELLSAEAMRVPIAETERVRALFCPENVGHAYRSLFEGLLRQHSDV